MPAGKLLGIDTVEPLTLFKIPLNGVDRLNRQLSLKHRLILMILTLHPILGKRLDGPPRIAGQVIDVDQILKQSLHLGHGLVGGH
jgi:hypothetical protein